MSREREEDREEGRRLYKARGADGEVAWVDHDELWRLQQSQAEEMRRQHARRRRLLLLTLAGLVAVALVLVFLRLWAGVGSPPADRMAEAPGAQPAPIDEVPETPPPAARDAEADSPATDELAAADEESAVTQGDPLATSSEPDSTTAAAEAEPVVAETVEEPLPEPDPAAEVGTAVRAWADGWARQDFAAYLGGYAASFQPPDGMSRSSWEGLRRRRVLEPTSIRVEIELLRITPLEDGRFEARFVQRYTSPRYSDVVDKRLLLVEEAGEWRIAAEEAGAPRGRDLG